MRTLLIASTIILLLCAPTKGAGQDIIFDLRTSEAFYQCSTSNDLGRSLTYWQWYSKYSCPWLNDSFTTQYSDYLITPQLQLEPTMDYTLHLSPSAGTESAAPAALTVLLDDEPLAELTDIPYTGAPYEGPAIELPIAVDAPGAHRIAFHGHTKLYLKGTYITATPVPDSALPLTCADSSEPAYYTLSGQPIKHLPAPGLYIRIAPDGTSALTIVK